MSKRLLLVFLVVAMMVAACGGDTTSTTAAPGTTAAVTTTTAAVTTTTAAVTTTAAAVLTDIVVGVPNANLTLWFPLCSAIGQGFFAEQGLNVTIEALDGSGPVLQALVAGQAQIGLPGPGPTLAARSRGEDVVAIYNLFARSLFGIVVPDESAAMVPADLKVAGEKIIVGVGTPEGGETSFARTVLTDAGLVEGTDFEFLAVGDGGPATAAFQRGEIAAYAAGIPDVAIIIARGLPLREITPEQYLTLFGTGVVTMKSSIDENPEMVQGFVTALLKGHQFANDAANKDAVLADCAVLAPEEASEPELAASTFDKALNRTQPLGARTFGQYDPAAWQSWLDSMLASGELQDTQDVNLAFTNTFIDSATAALGG